MKSKSDINKDILYTKYIIEKKSINQIAKEFNTPRSFIRRRLIRFQVPMRSGSEAIKLVEYPKEAYKKMSETKKRLYKEGKLIPPTKNPKTAEKMSKIMLSLWQNPNYREHQLKAVMKNLYVDYKNRSPNKQEQKLIKLLETNNLPYVFVGNGKIIIGKLCPDFISTDDKRKIIELFGDYWHTKKIRYYRDTEEGRIKYFKEYGYDCLVIWEKELKNLDNVLDKIKRFNDCVAQTHNS